MKLGIAMGDASTRRRVERVRGTRLMRVSTLARLGAQPFPTTYHEGARVYATRVGRGRATRYRVETSLDPSYAPPRYLPGRARVRVLTERTP